MTIKSLADLVTCLAIIQIVFTASCSLLIIGVIKKKKDE